MDFKKTALGLEFGSTRIKAVLIDDRHNPIASGSHEWENQLVDGIWTYSMEAIHQGLQACFSDLKRDVKEKFGQPLTTVGAMGISGMMHGYLPFDKDGSPLAGFRTWRNTITGPAAAELTQLFGFNIPTALEHRPSVPGYAERGRSSAEAGPFDHPGGLYP